MQIQKRKNSYLKLQNINFILHHPSILKNIIQCKSREEILTQARRLKEIQAERLALQESLKFISSLKNTSPYNINEKDYQPKLNRLCYIEDWKNEEFRNVVN
jgi:hypothetical protein